MLEPDKYGPREENDPGDRHNGNTNLNFCEITGVRIRALKGGSTDGEYGSRTGDEQVVRER